MQVPEKNRKERVWYNHLMVISEGIPSVGWIGVVSINLMQCGKELILLTTQEPKPGPHVAQMKEAAEFYGNKIIKEFKEKCVA